MNYNKKKIDKFTKIYLLNVLSRLTYIRVQLQKDKQQDVEQMILLIIFLNQNQN